MCTRRLDVDEFVDIRVIERWIEDDTHVLPESEISRLALKVWAWIENDGERNEEDIKFGRVC